MESAKSIDTKFRICFALYDSTSKDSRVDVWISLQHVRHYKFEKICKRFAVQVFPDHFFSCEISGNGFRKFPRFIAVQIFFEIIQPNLQVPDEYENGRKDISEV